MPKREIDIGKIRWDATDLQSRVSTSPAWVAEIAERMAEGVQFPAVTVFHDGKDYWPADGWHTGKAAEKAGFGTVLCDVREGTREDAFDFCLGANSTHGLPRSNADKRKAVELALKCGRHAAKSDSAIAELCGVGNWLVGKVREQVGAREPETRTGKDGKQYPAKRSPQIQTSGGETDARPESGKSQAPSSADDRASVIRDTVPFKPDATKRPVPFVDRFDSLFGPLVRFIEEAAQHYGTKGDASHKRAFDHLNGVANTYRAWRDAA